MCPAHCFSFDTVSPCFLSSSSCISSSHVFSSHAYSSQGWRHSGFPSRCSRAAVTDVSDAVSVGELPTAPTTPRQQPTALSRHVYFNKSEDEEDRAFAMAIEESKSTWTATKTLIKSLIFLFPSTQMSHCQVASPRGNSGTMPILIDKTEWVQWLSWGQGQLGWALHNVWDFLSLSTLYTGSTIELIFIFFFC